MNERRGSRRPILLGLILAVGLSVAWGAASGWLIAIGEQAQRRQTFWEDVNVRADGELLIARWEADSRVYRYRTLEGRPVSVPQWEAWLQRTTLHGPRPGRFGGLTPVRRMHGFQDGGDPPTYWYLRHNGREQGRAYFVGYDSRSKQCVGYLAREGLQSTLPALADQFAIDGRYFSIGGAFGGWSQNYGAGQYEPREAVVFSHPQAMPGWIALLVTDRGLFEVDLQKRTVRLRRPGADYFATNVLRRPSENERARDEIVLRTRDRLELLDSRTGSIRTFRLPPELREEAFELLTLSDDTLLARLSRMSRNAERNLKFVGFDEQGTVTRRQEVTLAFGASVPEARTWCYFGCAMPSPLALAAITAVRSLEDAHLGVSPTWHAALTGHIARAAPVLVVVCVLSLVLAARAIRHHAHHAQRGGRAWAVFVALLGPAGYLAYRLHRRWPAREACPSCQRVVPRDRLVCCGCGNEFPAPPPVGTEVLLQA